MKKLLGILMLLSSPAQTSFAVRLEIRVDDPYELIFDVYDLLTGPRTADYYNPETGSLIHFESPWMLGSMYSDDWLYEVMAADQTGLPPGYYWSRAGKFTPGFHEDIGPVALTILADSIHLEFRDPSDPRPNPVGVPDNSPVLALFTIAVVSTLAGQRLAGGATARLTA